MRARKTGDPKKETAAARRKRKKNQRSADEVLAKRAPQPNTRKTNRVSSEAKRTASVIKEGKRRTEKQKYRSEKTFRKESIRNISDSRAARLKKRFDKNVAKEDRLKNEASKGFDDTRGTKKGSVSKSRGRSVDTTKGAATLSRTRGRKVVKAVDRDKAMKLKKKLSKFAKGGKIPVVPPKPGDPGYDERDFRATDKYKKKLKKRAKKSRKAAIAKTAIGKKFKGAAARHAHRRVLDFKGRKYEYKPRKYKPKSDTTYAEGGKFPDLTGDGKVTRADVLKGRGVFKEGGKVSKPKSNPNEKVSYKGKIMKRSQMEAMWAKEDAPKERMTMAEYKKKKAKMDASDRANRTGKYKGIPKNVSVKYALQNPDKFASGGRVPKGKYRTSDGREISKSGRREAAIKEIRRKASNKAAKAHKRGQKKGKKIVGYRKGPGDPRMLTQRKLAVYKREKKQRDKGEKKVQKYIDKQAKKYAPKTKNQPTPRPPKVRTAGDSVKYNTPEKKRQDRCAKRGGKDCRRKQRRSGGSYAYK